MYLRHAHSLASRIQSLNIISHSKEQEFLREMFDPRSRTGIVQDEPETSCSSRKLGDHYYLLDLCHKGL